MSELLSALCGAVAVAGAILAMVAAWLFFLSLGVGLMTLIAMAVSMVLAWGFGLPTLSWLQALVIGFLVWMVRLFFIHRNK